MSSTTFKTTVYGDNFDEVEDKAEQEIASFLEINIEDVPTVSNYELLVSRDDDMGADFTYRAEVIARIKHDRK